MTATNAKAMSARIDAIESKLDAIMAAINGTNEGTASKPVAQPATKASKPALAVNVRIPGKPSKVYVEREWVWIKWENRPTDRTRAALKAAGWRYSVKRNAWHHVNTAN